MRVLLNFCRLLLTITIIKNEVESANSNTLTTAMVRENTSPKPTTVYRRIIVERDTVETSSTLVDIFQYMNARRKKNSRSYIWKWDHWCQLQPKRGNCEKNLNMFFYDSQLDQCLPFVYSGCDGNKNSFETLMDCERHCKGANFMNIEDSSQPSFCYLQPDAGLCLALINKFYYDINEKLCKRFTYGGCGGNQNKFDTMFSCMKTCKDTVT